MPSIATAEEFVSLRRSESKEDYLLAASANAPIEVWQDVVSRIPEMRKWVAHNKTVPIEVLSELARDPDAEVRIAVAMKNSLSGELFSLLATDVDDSVRQRVACNRNAPVQILSRLARDPCEFVSAEAKRRIATLEK